MTEFLWGGGGFFHVEMDYNFLNKSFSKFFFINQRMWQAVSEYSIQV